MLPSIYFKRMVSAIVKESGISRATVEHLLPIIFDVIRRQLVEGPDFCVPIESFGTFAIKDVPEREHLYTYKGKTELRHLPAKKTLKFAPTRNMRREIASGQFDPTRRAFFKHPDDRAIRKRKDLRYRPNQSGVHKGRTTFKDA